MELRDSVMFSSVQTILLMFDAYCAYGSAHDISYPNYMKHSSILVYPRLHYAWFGCVYVRLSEIGSTVGKIFLVFDFIIHTAYTVGACALTSILPSLSLMGMLYSTADTKATPASVQGVGVDF
jgi:hypothetical protein